MAIKLIKNWISKEDSANEIYNYYKENIENIKNNFEKITNDIDWEVKNNAIELFEELWVYHPDIPLNHYLLKIEIAHSTSAHLFLLQLVFFSLYFLFYLILFNDQKEILINELL